MSGLPESLAETAVALALFYLLYRAFLRYDTHFHLGRLYLVGSLALAFGLPLIDVPSPFGTVVAQPVPIHAVDLGRTQAGQADWWHVAAGVYLLGVGIMLIRLGWRLWQLARLTLGRRIVVENGLRVVYLDQDCPPFSFFRTVFVHRPPEADADAMAQVVAHERTHVRQGHSLDVLVVHLAAVFQWFNPIVWAYWKALTDLHEFLADREVLTQGHDRSAYARLLLSQHLGVSPLALAHQFRHSQIRRRLDMMTRHSARWTAAKYLLILPALAVLVAAYGEPRVVAAGDGAAIAQAASRQGAATGQKATADEARLAEQKAAQKEVEEAELNAKLKALEEQHNATSDPAQREYIKLKIRQLAAGNGGNTLKVSLDDPAALEDMLVTVNAKLEALRAKRASTTDPKMLEKLNQDAKSLMVTQKELKAALVQLKSSKQK